jgi:hypothetical protein
VPTRNVHRCNDPPYLACRSIGYLEAEQILAARAFQMLGLGQSVLMGVIKVPSLDWLFRTQRRLRPS